MDTEVGALLDKWANELKARGKPLDNIYLASLHAQASAAYRRFRYEDEMECKLEHAVAQYARGNIPFSASLFDRAAKVASALRQDSERAIFSTCAALLYERSGDNENAAYARLRAAESCAREALKKDDPALFQYSDKFVQRADELFESAAIKPQSIGMRSGILENIEMCKRRLKLARR